MGEQKKKKIEYFQEKKKVQTCETIAASAFDIVRAIGEESKNNLQYISTIIATTMKITSGNPNTAAKTPTQIKKHWKNKKTFEEIELMEKLSAVIIAAT